jgi:HPt (histidine-containing phosphotransfer) domain-containing protein
MDPVLDMSVVEELISFADDGDPELVLDLIQMFLDDGPTKVQAVVQGVADGDLERAERAAHSLKGSSGNLGAKLLSQVCEEVQNATRNHQVADSQRLAPALKQAYEAAEVELRRVLAEYQG